MELIHIIFLQILLLLVIGACSSIVFNNNLVTLSAITVFSIFSSFSIIFNYAFDFSNIFPDVTLYRNYIANNIDRGSYVEGSASQYAVIFSPLFFISGYNYYNFSLIQSAMFEISIILISKSVYNLGEVKKIHSYAVTSIIMHMYPSALIFSIASLREYVVFLAIGYFLLSLTENNRYKSVLYLSISSGFIYILRPLLVVGTISGYIVSRFGKFKIIAIIFSIIVGLLLFQFIRGRVFTFEWLLDVRAQRLLSEDSFVYSVDVDGYIPFQLVLLYFQFLLSPLQILHNQDIIHMRLFLIDLVFVISIIFVSFYAFIKNVSKYGFLIWAFLMISMLPALWEAYLGGAVRHRIPAILILVTISSHWLAQAVRGWRE